ncbi:MAG: hypothetical protein COA78_21195 [Blastopirellula sp.]|nr:MAG: hypothetical protein COA78_21195 [Blastopirellula sp.]
MLTLREKHRHEATVAQLKADVAKLKLELTAANNAKSKQKSRIFTMENKLISSNAKVDKLQVVIKLIRSSIKGM